MDMAGCPKTGNGAFIGIAGKDGRKSGGCPHLVYVLYDDQRFADGLAIVEENGHLLVDGVGVEEELALAEGQLLLQGLVGNALDVEGYLHSKHEGARPHALGNLAPTVRDRQGNLHIATYCLDDVPGNILHNERAKLELELNLDQLELDSTNIWLGLSLT
ncbi:hypothetical protein EJ110_NYTH47511 [Nymphaea thermarum]|nr:hypothetical protein EJ110_NYTH47511 [Nymphaea thermarum]